MMNEDFSCVKDVTKIVNLTLPFMYNTNEISGICDTLESWKRQHVKQLQGVVVGYKNVSLTSKRGYLKLDLPVIYCNVKATFELFYPTIGSIIKGKINRISQDYIGCLVHDTINVTVHQTADLASDISKFIALDRFILFQITHINFKSKFIHVKGKITEECVTLMKESGLLSDDIDVPDNELTCSSPDLFNNVLNSNPITSNSSSQNTGELDMSTDTSSQTSSHKKKKKHKKSKDNFSMAPSLISGSLENNIDQVELTQSSANSKKRKHKKSDVNFTSPSNTENKTEPVHPKKKIKTEEFIPSNINKVELFQSPDKTRKRKRKKSDSINLASPTNSLENENEPIHHKKKMKTNEQVSLMNSNSGNINSISTPTSNINLSHIAAEIENPAVKVELLSPVKKKKQKKSKNSLDAPSSLSDHTLKTEINKFATSPHKTTPSSHIKSEEDFLTSPDLFDESLNELKSKTESVKPKKKKKKRENVSDKSKSRKRKKDKLKKGSKKDKKKKPKVISTKKKPHGHGVKLKKKKSKDKKSKEGKKKSKSDKTKCVPE